MLINEVIQTVKENYYEDLIVAIQDELSKGEVQDKGEIDTEELQMKLSSTISPIIFFCWSFIKNLEFRWKIPRKNMV